MSLVYRFIYRVGFTPWDTGTIPAPRTELIDGDDGLEPASALDIGCGTGTQAVYLARQAQLEPGFAVVLDRGCFHGLSDDGRAGYVDGVTALAAAGATLLLMAFARNRIVAGPAGADQAELASRFSAGWELQRSDRDVEPPPGGPLRGVPLTWYRLRRNGSHV
ncbi:MAG TPA: hypothetical protein VG410_09325 [Solirubrobacteraceae bacterium]|nr:hypothetical protein [Solirubrobacteraceae bacterium]